MVNTKRSAKQFARRHRGGILTTSMPASARTASNDAVNCPARSRTRNRSRPTCSPRSISRLRACWVVHGPSGWATSPAGASGDFARQVDIGAGRSIFLECRGQGTPTIVLESGYHDSSDPTACAKPEPDHQEVPQPADQPEDEDFYLATSG